MTGNPVVALDLDGVINALVSHGAEPPGFTRHQILIDRRGWPDHRFLSALPPGTWQSAVLPLAHLAGIPKLPVIEFDQLANPWERFGWTAPHWKLDVLRTVFPGRPVCWIDDQSRGFGRTSPRPSDRFRVVAPAPSRGLTRRNADVVSRWVARH